MTGTAVRPNVLWISTHDINPHLGSYAGVYPGADAAVTPNLDRLAAEGVRFDSAFATAPVCAPARSSIVTGTFPASIGTMHMRSRAVPPPEVRLLPEYFRQAGYYTTNNWFTDFQMPVPATAFDDWSDTAHWRNRDASDQPFFAMFHGMTTHESRMYLDDEAFAAATPHVRGEDRHDPESVALPPYHPDTPVFRTAWARYHDLITEMDWWVGDLLRQLEEDGLADNTIVVFWSDHGLGMPRGKRWATEAGLHEPLIMRWPDVIPPGTVHRGLVHVMDIAPTMLSACGIPVPEHMQATPLLDEDGVLIERPNEYVVGSRDRMDEQEDMSRTIRDERFRYTRNLHPDRSPMQHCNYPDRLATWAELRRLVFEESQQVSIGHLPDKLMQLQRTIVAPDKPAEELYDLIADPHEEHNLAGVGAHEQHRLRLSAALAAWAERHGDLGTVPEADLVQQWRPDGSWKLTDAPVIVSSTGALEATCATPGALIAWTTDAPTGGGLAEDGGYAPDGRRWRILCEATPAPPQQTVWLQAWRLGYLPSDEVPVAAALSARADPVTVSSRYRSVAAS